MSILSYQYASTISAHHNDVWMTNGYQTKDDIYYFKLVSEKCIYCSNKLEQIKYTKESLYKTSIISLCQHCGWWREKESQAMGQDSCQINIKFGEAKYYHTDSIDVPIEDLRNHLKKHPNNLANINPYKFEHLMADVLKSYYPESEIIHLGGRGDGGIDIKLIMTQNESYLVQVKRRSNITKNEGIQVVRELNGVLFREGESKGMIITTANDFTAGAKKEAASIKTKISSRYKVKLLSFGDIVNMLNLKRKEPYEPWNNTNKIIRHRNL